MDRAIIITNAAKLLRKRRSRNLCLRDGSSADRKATDLEEVLNVRASPIAMINDLKVMTS
jgi:hypothetical protein